MGTGAAAEVVAAGTGVVANAAGTELAWAGWERQASLDRVRGDQLDRMPAARTGRVLVAWIGRAFGARAGRVFRARSGCCTRPGPCIPVRSSPLLRGCRRNRVRRSLPPPPPFQVHRWLNCSQTAAEHGMGTKSGDSVIAGQVHVGVAMLRHVRPRRVTSVEGGSVRPRWVSPHGEGCLASRPRVGSACCRRTGGRGGRTRASARRGGLGEPGRLRRLSG